MNLEDVKQSLIRGKFNKDMKIIYTERDLDRIFFEDPSNHEAFMKIRTDYANDESSIKDLLIFLICISHKIKLKKEYLPSHKIIHEFFICEHEKEFKGLFLNLDGLREIFLDDILTSEEIKINIVLEFIDKYPMDNECIEYLIDNSTVGIFDTSVDFDIMSYETFPLNNTLKLSDIKYKPLILEGLIKNNKLKIKDDNFNSLILYCLFNNEEKMLDIVLKYESKIPTDKININKNINYFSSNTYERVRMLVNSSMPKYILVTSLEKISSLEGFDDFLKNNYDLIIKRCNKEAVNYVKNRV